MLLLSSTSTLIPGISYNQDTDQNDILSYYSLRVSNIGNMINIRIIYNIQPPGTEETFWRIIKRINKMPIKKNQGTRVQG